MTTRAWVLCAILAIGLMAYVVFFTGLFGGHPDVELLLRQTPTRNGTDVTVALIEKASLKQVTVERVDDGSVTWQVDGEPMSEPTKAVRYGKKIKDMAETVPAQPLQPGVEYRVIVVADGGKAQMQFTAKGRG